jgi:hypothetical protein
MSSCGGAKFGSSVPLFLHIASLTMAAGHPYSAQQAMVMVLPTAELWKPKRAAKTPKAEAMRATYASSGMSLVHSQSGIMKAVRKRPGSAPVLGGHSEDPQLAFRHKHGSKEKFNELARRLIGTEMHQRTDATDKQKSQVVWTGIVCLLHSALYKCEADGLQAREFTEYIARVLPPELHGLLGEAPGREGTTFAGLQRCSECGAKSDLCVIHLLKSRQLQASPTITFQPSTSVTYQA